MGSVKPQIDLVWLTEDGDAPPWVLGDASAVPPTSHALHDVMERLVEESSADAFLFWHHSLGRPEAKTIKETYALPGNVWHAGLRLGTGGQPGLIDFLRPTWMFNRDPDPTIAASSWRISLSACLIQRQVLEQMGGVRAAFCTLQAAALELGHRYISQGVLTRHIPNMLSDVGTQERQPDALPLDDELRFAYFRFGKLWSFWALAHAVLTGYASPLDALRAAGRVFRSAEGEEYRAQIFSHPSNHNAMNTSDSVTVLIPTVDRYPYLETLLRQLREQTVSPMEIIVVDQTPGKRRRPDLYASLRDLPLRVVFQDTAGQCSSRNRGLQMAAGEYVLFLDDDDEIPSNLIELHLQNLSGFHADVSSGAVEEVGAGPIPHAFTYTRLSDVFPTDNTLIRREVLRKSGLFDLAYERGQNEDGDLGMRVYLTGTMMIYSPSAKLLHHHAPRGGLRTHKARVITYASSRQKLLHRHLPSVSEIYLAKRYFTPRQVRESLRLRVFGTFAIRGGPLRKLLKMVVGIVYLPHTLYEVRRREKAAAMMLRSYPQIPSLSTTSQHQDQQYEHLEAH